MSVADRDNAGDAGITAFVMNSGVEGGNPFENHTDLSTLTLGGGAADYPNQDWDVDGATNAFEISEGTDPLDATDVPENLPNVPVTGIMGLGLLAGALAIAAARRK